MRLINIRQNKKALLFATMLKLNLSIDYSHLPVFTAK